MELSLTVTPSIHEKHDTLDINGYLFIFNRQYQRKIDDNLVPILLDLSMRSTDTDYRKK